MQLFIFMPQSSRRLFEVAELYLSPFVFGYRNILVDKPNDQSSRWSSESNYPPQVSSVNM